MRKPGTIDLWISDHSNLSWCIEALLALAVADGRLTVTGDDMAKRINDEAAGLRCEREAAPHQVAGTFKTYTGFTVEDWPYVYTTPADRQSDAPYAFWQVAGTFKTYTGFTVEDWPYVYTTPADRQSDAPYAFWLGKEGHA